MRGRVLAALLISGLIGPASAFAALNGAVELVDRPSGFGPLPFDGINEASVDRHAFSNDGCFLVITSNNDVLSTLDDDKGDDIFRVNRCVAGHPAELVSVTKDGVAADDAIFSPSISADGKKIAFTTSARNLLPPGTTIDHAVVVKDMETGAVTLASRSNGADGAVADAFTGVISGDGGAVAFTARGAVEGSNATGVADQDDIYVRYLAAGETRMASVIPPSTRGGADGDFDVNYDGTAVALITQAALDPGDSDGHASAYLMRNLLGTPTADKVSGTSTRGRRDLRRRHPGRLHRRPRLDGDLRADLRRGRADRPRDPADGQHDELRRRIPRRTRGADGPVLVDGPRAGGRRRRWRVRLLRPAPCWGPLPRAAPRRRRLRRRLRPRRRLGVQRRDPALPGPTACARRRSSTTTAATRSRSRCPTARRGAARPTTRRSIRATRCRTTGASW